MNPIKIAAMLIASIALLTPGGPSAEPVAVHHMEGLGHGFLALRSEAGTLLASGDQTQLAQGDRVTNRIVFRFKDGSIHDETAVFSQRGHLRLITYHLIQKGPTFPRPLDMTMDTQSGQVAVHYTDEHGENKSDVERLELPDDLGNGMMNTVLKNVQRDAPSTTVSYVAITPKPRIVKLIIRNGGTDSFSTAGSTHSATHYIVKVDIGGVAGLVAPLLGKDPPDSHVWILTGDAPVFVRSDTTLYFGGPTWRIDPVAPTWTTR
jgi:hypothetical protein